MPPLSLSIGRCYILYNISAGNFAACGRRVSFWMPRKKPKRHQGVGSGWALRAHIRPPPGPPFYGGPNQAAQVVIAKARAVQLIGYPSMAAAAERFITFGYCSSRWKARLCCGETQVRLRESAYPKRLPALRRGDPCGRPFLCGPAVREAAPYICHNPRRRAAQCAAPTAYVLPPAPHFRRGRTLAGPPKFMPGALAQKT